MGKMGIIGKKMLVCEFCLKKIFLVNFNKESYIVVKVFVDVYLKIMLAVVL